MAATDSVSLLSWKNDDNLGTVWKISKATDQTVGVGMLYPKDFVIEESGKHIDYSLNSGGTIMYLAKRVPILFVRPLAVMDASGLFAMRVQVNGETVSTGERFTSESSSWSGFVAIPMCTGIGYLSIFNKFNAGDTCAEIYFPYI